MAAGRVLGTSIGSLNEGLKPRNIVWVSEVDHIYGDSVLLESSSNVLEVLLCSFQWMAYEYNNSLALRFVLSMLERQLSNLNRFEAVRDAIYNIKGQITVNMFTYEFECYQRY